MRRNSGRSTIRSPSPVTRVRRESHVAATSMELERLVFPRHVRDYAHRAWALTSTTDPDAVPSRDGDTFNTIYDATVAITG